VIVLDLLLSAALGYMMHQSANYTDKLPDGWRELTDHAVGVVFSLPAFILWFIRLRDVDNLMNRAVLAYVCSFAGVGSGVAAGWMVDTFTGKSHLHTGRRAK